MGLCRIGVLLDVEILLHDPAGVGEKGPVGAETVAVLVGGEQIVRRDGH